MKREPSQCTFCMRKGHIHTECRSLKAKILNDNNSTLNPVYSRNSDRSNARNLRFMPYARNTNNSQQSYSQNYSRNTSANNYPSRDFSQRNNDYLRNNRTDTYDSPRGNRNYNTDRNFPSLNNNRNFNSNYNRKNISENPRNNRNFNNYSPRPRQVTFSTDNNANQNYVNMPPPDIIPSTSAQATNLI